MHATRHMRTWSQLSSTVSLAGEPAKNQAGEDNREFAVSLLAIELLMTDEVKSVPCSLYGSD